MKNLVLISLMLGSSAVMANEFDITMDVVAADESFDQVIVNHIALPFMDSSTPKVNAKLEAISVTDIDEISGLVSEGLDDPSVERGLDGPGSGLDIDSMSIDEIRVVLPQ